jgi:tetratricopeptide (TPR) repeat protein
MPIRPRVPVRGAAAPIVSAGKSDPRRDATHARRVDEQLALRLVIGRDGVGLELAHPVRLGCITVSELTATLPGIRFPVDVSGGVPRFRHRRGVLQSLELEVSARAVERWAAPRLRGLVGTRTPEVWIGVRQAGATVGVVATPDPEEEAALRTTPILAFDVEALADRDDLTFVVKRARGTDLPSPATAMAVACFEAMVGGIAKREGAAFVLRSGATALARALLPEAGARVPAAAGLGWTSLTAHGESWIIHAAREALVASPSEDAVRAHEIARMIREADDALVGGDTGRARTLYLDALDRAPRHGEIVRRVLEIDARAAERAEAALATLAQAMQVDGETDFGTLPGELLARVGDTDAAIASLERAGETEPTPALAARAFEMAAGITRDSEEASRWLDRALARAPQSATARWSRVTRRLEMGRLEDALADVEHLEALARGSRARYAVWLRGGRAWQAAGLEGRAAVLFERALRHAPEDPNALAGLGASLVREGRVPRGVAVLTRAVELAEGLARDEGAFAVPAATSRILLDLARALAEGLDDLPTAIARVAAISSEAFEAPVARGLEGRWRAKLGDVSGAALAFARLRELASSFAALADDARVPAIVGLLCEGAELQRSRLRDARGAQRYLAAALRLRPHDEELRRAYREVGALVVGEDRGPTTESEAAGHPASAQGPRLSLDLALAAEPPSTEEEVRANARVEELTRQLQGDPRNAAAADELAALLQTLGRGHELLALLSARLEDATPEERVELAPRALAALERLATQAESAGRLEEAALYRSAMETLGG